MREEGRGFGRSASVARVPGVSVIDGAGKVSSDSPRSLRVRRIHSERERPDPFAVWSQRSRSIASTRMLRGIFVMPTYIHQRTTFVNTNA
jgi:hypothetical protein